MKRHALILVNTARTGNKNTDVDLKQARDRATRIADILKDLGEYSFTSRLLIDPDHQDAQIQLNKAFEQFGEMIGDENSILLIYYFGHAVDRVDGLHFCFKDSNIEKIATLLSFDWLVKQAFGYKNNNVIFMLDCCYAGASIRNIQRNPMVVDGKYALLCSAIPTQKANILPGISPFGVFSYTLFDGLKDPRAVESDTDNVTVGSLFQYTQEMLSNKDLRVGEVHFDQLPFLSDGGLGNLILTKTYTEKRLIPNSNRDAPTKSYYSKYRWIGGIVNQRGKISYENLYDLVRTNKPEEFLTPIKRDTITAYEPVKESTFETYINGMQILGILLESEPLEFTDVGKDMFRRNEANYNRLILQLIEKQLVKGGLSLEGLEKLLRNKMITRRITSASELYKDAKNRLRVNLSSSWFSILLDLLSYTGYIKATTKKTFYPYF